MGFALNSTYQPITYTYQTAATAGITKTFVAYDYTYVASNISWQAKSYPPKNWRWFHQFREEPEDVVEKIEFTEHAVRRIHQHVSPLGRRQIKRRAFLHALRSVQ